MKKFTKIVSLLTAAALLSSFLGIYAFAADETNYAITDPYASVDWNSWDYYKGNLHVHTTFSDGEILLPDMVEEYYDRDYDILALTDHGVINPGWTEDRYYNSIFNMFQDTKLMSEKDYERVTTGSDRGGRGMTDVTGGIEMNMATLQHNHVNGYFTDVGVYDWGNENDYETAVKNVHESGKGYTVLNHIGDWTAAPKHPERSHSPEIISYFANILAKYDSCLGMEIVNDNDVTTNQDRALWDELLQVVIPTGRNITAFANDDSHSESEIDQSFEMFLMPENNAEEVEKAMKNGTLFACTKYVKDGDEPDYDGNGNVPLVKDIEVNQEDNTISLTLDETRDCKTVEWIADGKVIATGSEIDLNDYEDELGCYIRFQMKGEGGITYSQAFVLEYEGRVDKAIPDNMDKYDTIPGKMVLIGAQNRIFGLIVLIFRQLSRLF